MYFNIKPIIQYPIRIIFSLVGITIFLAMGIQWIYIDDDMMKMLPKEIESRISWEEIQSEFGNVDLMFVTLGDENKSVLTSENLKIVWDLTEKIGDSPLVEEVMSISNLDKIESVDGFMEVSPLQESREISIGELESIQNYIQNNPKINSQFFDVHVSLP